MYTINQLGKKFDLSRSTLLYYDKIDLLKPSSRSEANYRLYSNDDLERMEKIATYREAGVSLESIAEILSSGDTKCTTILEQRLDSLNSEISRLRQQQQSVVTLLGRTSLMRSSKVMSKDQWVNILKASGMDEDAMRRWHIEFERDLPEAHTDFLESLGIGQEEIKAIKVWSKP